VWLNLKNRCVMGARSIPKHVARVADKLSVNVIKASVERHAFLDALHLAPIRIKERGALLRAVREAAGLEHSTLVVHSNRTWAKHIEKRLTGAADFNWNDFVSQVSAECDSYLSHNEWTADCGLIDLETKSFAVNSMSKKAYDKLIDAADKLVFEGKGFSVYVSYDCSSYEYHKNDGANYLMVTACVKDIALACPLDVAYRLDVIGALAQDLVSDWTDFR
jgi:hypothetical protein